MQVILCDSSRETRCVRKSYYGLGVAAAKLAEQHWQSIHLKEYFHLFYPAENLPRMRSDHGHKRQGQSWENRKVESDCEQGAV